MKGLGILLVLVATPAWAADQFDLVCTAKKSEARYRVDLTRGDWCQADCSRIEKIAEVNAGMLVLERREKQFPRDDRFLTQVNRATGEWFRVIQYGSSGRGPTLINGRCDLAAFSGFPAAKF